MKNPSRTTRRKAFASGVLVVLGTLILSSCASATKTPLAATRQHGYSVEIVPGKNYSNWGWFGIIPFSKGPQIAVWIESPGGTFVKTVSVTARAGDDSWIGASKRPEALPVWNSRRGSKVDGLSAPTADKAQWVPVAFEIAQGTTIYVEVNQSYDWNKVWQKNLPERDPHENGVNGQPSIVYRAVVKTDHRPSEVTFDVIGQGDPQGLTGTIVADLTGIDSALTIIKTPVLRDARY